MVSLPGVSVGRFSSVISCRRVKSSEAFPLKMRTAIHRGPIGDPSRRRAHLLGIPPDVRPAVGILRAVPSAPRSVPLPQMFRSTMAGDEGPALFVRRPSREALIRAWRRLCRPKRADRPRALNICSDWPRAGDYVTSSALLRDRCLSLRSLIKRKYHAKTARVLPGRRSPRARRRRFIPEWSNPILMLDVRGPHPTLADRRPRLPAFLPVEDVAIEGMGVGPRPRDRRGRTPLGLEGALKDWPLR